MPLSSLNLEHWAPERLVRYARNPRKNDAVVDRMVEAIREFGFRIPTSPEAKAASLIHLRLKAAQALGLDPRRSRRARTCRGAGVPPRVRRARPPARNRAAPARTNNPRRRSPDLARAAATVLPQPCPVPALARRWAEVSIAGAPPKLKRPARVIRTPLPSQYSKQGLTRMRIRLGRDAHRLVSKAARKTRRRLTLLRARKHTVPCSSFIARRTEYL